MKMNAFAKNLLIWHNVLIWQKVAYPETVISC